MENWVDPINTQEVLSQSPFAKVGDDTWENRFVYFAPVDTGNVWGGAYVGNGNLDLGAVQSAGGPAAVLDLGSLRGGFH